MQPINTVFGKVTAIYSRNEATVLLLPAVIFFVNAVHAILQAYIFTSRRKCDIGATHRAGLARRERFPTNEKD